MADVGYMHTLSHLLLVDPDPQTQRRLPALLTPYGIEVVGADDLRGALQALGDVTPDLMIVDGVSRRFDGADTVYRLRQLESLKQIPLLFFTSAHDPAARRLGVEAGANDFLTKPIEETELICRVHNYTHFAREHRNIRRRVNVHLSELRRQIAALKETVWRHNEPSPTLSEGHAIAMERLAQAAEMRDDATGQHSKRVAEYCKMLARRVGFDEPYAEMLRVASPLHDVGKLAIPDRILLKRGQLSSAEFAVVKRHPWMGFQMLSNTGAPVLDLAASIALTHHEKFDGSGYPYGLSGDDIPMEGRITAIADVFDALTSTRCYKPAYSVNESLYIMRAGRGKHFDPALLDLFMGSLDEASMIRAQHAH